MDNATREVVREVLMVCVDAAKAAGKVIEDRLRDDSKGQLSASVCMMANVTAAEVMMCSVRATLGPSMEAHVDRLAREIRNVVMDLFSLEEEDDATEEA